MENTNLKKENALEVFGTIMLILGIIGFVVLSICSFKDEGVYIHSTEFMPDVFAYGIISLISGIGTFLFFRVISEISKTLKINCSTDNNASASHSVNNIRQTTNGNDGKNNIRSVENKNIYFKIGDTAVERSSGRRVIITNVNDNGTYQCETEDGVRLGNLHIDELLYLNE